MHAQNDSIVDKKNTKTFSSSLILNGLAVLLGSVFLALTAQIAIPLPFTAVPISLQTLAISLLAIALGPQKAFLAVAAYLLQATAGLPVLAGGLVNPLWILGPTAGYLIGFLIASFVVSTMLRRYSPQSLVKTWLILSLSELIILTIGTLWLGCLVGMHNAIIMGCLPFLPGALLKITVATTAYKPVQWITKIL